MGALLYAKPASYIKVVLVAAASASCCRRAALRYRWLWSRRPLVIVPARCCCAWLTALAWRVRDQRVLRVLRGDWMAGEPGTPTSRAR